MRLHKSRLTVIGILFMVALIPETYGTAEAIELLNGFGGLRGYGTEGLGRNDDGSTDLLPCPLHRIFSGTRIQAFTPTTMATLHSTGRLVPIRLIHSQLPAISQ